MWTRCGLRLPAAEKTGQKSAPARGAAHQLLFQLSNPGLSAVESLLLHDDCLGHEIRRTWLGGDAGANESLRLGVASAALALDLTKLGEESLDGLTVLMIHCVRSWLIVVTIVSCPCPCRPGAG
jgi:hypothetical protein